MKSFVEWYRDQEGQPHDECDKCHKKFNPAQAKKELRDLNDETGESMGVFCKKCRKEEWDSYISQHDWGGGMGRVGD